MDASLNLLRQFFSDYVVALAVIVVAFVYAVWKLASHFQSMKDKVDSLDNLPCAHHDLRLNSHESQFSVMREMKGQLDLLLKFTIDKNRASIFDRTDDYSIKNSPRQLNENGILLLQDCGGSDFLKQNTDFFISEMETIAPKTPLDVEELAASVLLAHSGDDIFIPLKNWVYNAPARLIKSQDGSERMTEVNLNHIIFVMSIPLRDKYLERHPEIVI